jgi:hypothetical protein
MLSERVQQLLTAYVDGELNDRQRQEVLRILKESDEARTLLAQLESDVAALRKLPAQTLPPDFSRSVMEAIEREPARLPAGRVRKLPATALAWSGLAASLLVAAALGSYLYFTPRPNVPLPTDLVAVAGQKQAPALNKDDEEALRLTRDKNAAAPMSRPTSNVPAPTAPLDDARPRSKPAMAPAAQPALVRGLDKAAKESELGSGALKPGKLEVIPPSLPLTFPVSDLVREERSQRLRQELENQKAIYVDLMCKGNGKAVDRLQEAFQAQGIGLLVDGDAHARLERRTPADYLLYVQEITAVELVAVLGRLAEEDVKAEADRRGSGQFDTMVVLDQVQQARQDLAGVLSVDPLQLLARGSVPADVRRTMVQGAAKQAADGLAGQASSRADAGKSAVKIWERWALVLSYHPVRPKSLPSTEIRQFLDTRKPRRSDSVQVFLVLHKN